MFVKAGKLEVAVSPPSSLLVATLAIVCGYWVARDASPQIRENGGVIAQPYCSRELSTLRQLVVVFRHGVPNVVLPNSGLQQKDQLAHRGVEQAFNLGQWLNRCYTPFLRHPASPRHVFVRSTNYNRTLLSAGAYLHGLYPTQPAEEDIAINTVPVNEDDILRGHKNCPRYYQLVREIDGSERPQAILREDADFWSMVAQRSGLKTNSLRSTFSIAKTVQIVLENDFPAFEWLNGERNITKMTNYNNLKFDLYYNNAEMAKIIGGPLLQEIIRQMKARASRSSSLKHIVYSSHSTVMGGLLGTTGTLNNLEPPFASAIIFELHQINGLYSVMTFYRNSTAYDPVPLDVPGCYSNLEHGCRLDAFAKALTNRTSRSRVADCSLKNNLHPLVRTSSCPAMCKPK